MPAHGTICYTALLYSVHISSLVLGGLNYIYYNYISLDNFILYALIAEITRYGFRNTLNFVHNCNSYLKLQPYSCLSLKLEKATTSPNEENTGN